MNFDFNEFAQLMITTKKKSGLLPCLAGLVSVIREVVAADGTDAEKIAFIDELCKLSKRHLKI